MKIRKIFTLIAAALLSLSVSSGVWAKQITLLNVSYDPTRELYEEYNNILKNIAQKEKVNYIPLYEELHKQILASPGKAFTKFSFLSFYRDYIFREFLLRKSFDAIAKLNGWKYHIDGVHLNTNGGKILVELVQNVLEK